MSLYNRILDLFKLPSTRAMEEAEFLNQHSEQNVFQENIDLQSDTIKNVGMSLYNKMLDKFKLQSTRDMENVEREQNQNTVLKENIETHFPKSSKPKNIDLEKYAIMCNASSQHEEEMEQYNQNFSDRDQRIYFRNGKLYKVYPTDEESWYDARFLISDGSSYDLENGNDLSKIPVPRFKDNDLMEGYGITGSLEYVLKMKAAKLRDKGKIKESDILYKRLYLFMGAADNGYREKDFLAYPCVLLKEFRFEEAEKEKQIIQNYLKNLKVFNGTFSFYNIENQLMDKLLADCKKYDTDYIAMSAHCACCEECNKLQGRVYSISGKSKIFPKLPDVIKETGGVHAGCSHSFSVYFFHGDGEDTVHDKMGNSVNAVKASRRPFVDDRTEEEKQNYLDCLRRKRKEENWWENEVSRQKERQLRMAEYNLIVKEFPDIAPKSFNGYSRMKNGKTKNFMKLYNLAKEKGIEIKL